VHSHEPANASAEPADFVRLFARRAIDAGAHAVVGHGPHRLRGLEAYQGGLILYSVGDFVSQAADVAPGGASDFDAGGLMLGGAAVPRPAAPPSETASLAVLLDFFDGALARARLEPLELGRKGTPAVAGPEKRAEILEILQRLSAPGTRILADEVALH
jgi:poly-gamma-glutamate synthesis protein (capsule biosynthesis protein)